MSEQADTNGEACRPWWRNCALKADAEILHIDRLEDEMSPLAPAVSRIRELISTLELCHHKAERWVYNVIEAIGSGETSKGLGTRPPGQSHPVERTWQNACTALSAWCAGSPAASAELTIGDRPASEVLGRLGQRSPLKQWQVQRVIERIGELIGWPRSNRDASTGYVPILESGGDYQSARRGQCPAYYREHADYWHQTVQTPIRDTEVGVPHSVYGDSEYGEAAELSLATAIDVLWPCHWDFVQNLEIVLGAIGGDLKPARPFAFCARNIELSPIRDRMRTVCHTLGVFRQNRRPDEKVDAKLLGLLGKTSQTKQWLAASLEKTIRLQLDL